MGKDNRVYLGHVLISFPDGMTPEELRDFFESRGLGDVWGGCDAVMSLCVVKASPIVHSQMIVSVDGKTGNKLDGNDLFDFWLVAGHQLLERLDMSPERREALSRAMSALRRSSSTGGSDGDVGKKN